MLEDEIIIIINQSKKVLQGKEINLIENKLNKIEIVKIK